MAPAAEVADEMFADETAAKPPTEKTSQPAASLSAIDLSALEEAVADIERLIQSKAKEQ